MGAEFSWVVDAVVGVLIIVSAYLAMVRGFFREIFALLSWAIAFFAAFYFAPVARPLLIGLPVIGDFMEDCQVAMLVAFVVVFGVALIVTGLIVWMFSGPSRNTAVSIFDQGLGFIYGALRGLVLVAVIYIGYQEIVPASDRFDFVNAAYSIQFVEQAADVVRSLIPTEMPAWLESRVQEMMGECPDTF